MKLIGIFIVLIGLSEPQHNGTILFGLIFILLAD